MKCKDCDKAKDEVQALRDTVAKLEAELREKSKIIERLTSTKHGAIHNPRSPVLKRNPCRRAEVSKFSTAQNDTRSPATPRKAEQNESSNARSPKTPKKSVELLAKTGSPMKVSGQTHRHQKLLAGVLLPHLLLDRLAPLSVVKGSAQIAFLLVMFSKYVVHTMDNSKINVPVT
eukprot:m.247536 g.247536  ORF g.247536 m.247536 type:complete len:174 (-) comp16127_c0_seq4:7242-7763(-)